MTKKIGKIRLSRETLRELNRGVPGMAAVGTNYGFDSHNTCPFNSYVAACPPSRDSMCVQCIQ